jgi:hypothetical protein
MLTKKKTAILVLALAMCIGVASAALLQYYAKIQTTVNVTQGILVDGHSYETPITEEVPATVGGGIVYTVHTIQNLGDKEATVCLSWESNDTEGINVTYFVNQATLTLENKDPETWQPIEDNVKATLTYCIVGDTFIYKLVATGLTPSTSYSLIYYADFEPERFTYWGGNNPGALIAEVTSDEHGYVSQTGEIDLGMDLPSPPDANIAIYDYSGPPDNYAHAHGAKIWLVPNTDLTNGNSLPVINWEHHADWLYETDLITYLDLDSVSTHLLHPAPEFVTEITVPAHSTISFAIRFDFAENAYGTYLVTTTVSPPK